MQPGQCSDRQVRLRGGAAEDLIALFGRCHIGQQQYELRPLIGDRAVIAPRQGHRDGVGHLGVEGVFGAVTQRDAVTYRLILGRQFDDETPRQTSVRAVTDSDAIGRAGLAGADRADVHRIDSGAEDIRQPRRGYLIRRYRDIHEFSYPSGRFGRIPR